MNLWLRILWYLLRLHESPARDAGDTSVVRFRVGRPTSTPAPT